jgi:hypothetical protein
VAHKSTNRRGGAAAARQDHLSVGSNWPAENNRPGCSTQHIDPTIDATLALLCEIFPNCFVRYEARRRPLKIGIHLDLLAVLNGAVTEGELKRALRIYVNNRVYRSRLQAGTQ